MLMAEASADKYQQEFISFQKDLKSFIYRLVTDFKDAEDIAQDTYIKTFKSLYTFKGQSSFKTWVFTIANNLAKDFLRSQKRWQEDYQDKCRTVTYASQEIRDEMADINQNSPHGKYVLKEHVDFCFTCMTKTLPLQEQVCLMLKEVYGFKVSDIMEIAGLSEGRVKHALADSRNKMHDIFDKRCSLVNKEGVCYQCTELNGIFNPKQNAEEEANKLKMVKERGKSNFKALLNLRLQLSKNIDPLNSEGFALHNYMLENLESYA